MAGKKRPLVVIPRKLPDPVETRMRELFDARLNVEDRPMTQPSWSRRQAKPTCWCRPSPTRSTRADCPGRARISS
jgi:hypothetical protein